VKIPRDRTYVRFRDFLHNTFDSVGGFVVLLRACIDDAGSHEHSQVVTLGGYIAWSYRWRDLEYKWRRVLSSYHVKCSHMKYFAHRKKEFENWPEPKRQSFMKQLAGCLVGNVRYGFVASVYRSDYDEAVSERIKGRLRSPIALCAYICLSQIEMYLRDLEYNKKAVITFALGTPHMDDISAAYYESYPTEISQEKREYRPGSGNLIPLQAADLLAYEGCKRLNDHLVGKEDVRWPLKTIVNEVPHLLVHFNREMLYTLNRQLEEKTAYEG